MGWVLAAVVWASPKLVVHYTAFEPPDDFGGLKREETELVEI